MASAKRKFIEQRYAARRRKIPFKFTFEGEKHGRAKLTTSDILTIRSSTLTSRELSEKFKVRQTTITRIKRKANWDHI